MLQGYQTLSQKDLCFPHLPLVHPSGLTSPPSGRQQLLRASCAPLRTSLLVHSASSSQDLTHLGGSKKLGIRCATIISPILVPFNRCLFKAYKSVYDAAVFCLEHGGRLAGKVEEPVEATRHCATIEGRLLVFRFPTHSQETISEVRRGTCLLWFLEVQHSFQGPET